MNKGKNCPPLPLHTHTAYRCTGKTRGHSGIHFLMGCDQEGHGGHPCLLTLLASRPQERLRRTHASTISPPGRQVKQTPPASCHPRLDASPFHALPPSSIKGKKEGGKNHPPKMKFTEKNPTLALRDSLGTKRGVAERLCTCFGIGFQGSGPHAPISSIWHPVTPCLYFPPSSSLGPSPYWLVTERCPPPCMLLPRSHKLQQLPRRGPLGSERGYRFIHAALTHLHIELCI